MKFETNKKILIAGHRGNPSVLPENTLESFKSAIECGVDMLETDIHLTKDNVLILMHDDDVKRTTDGEGLIREKTYEEIKTLNAGTAKQPMSVPTLREFLEYSAGIPDLLLNLEIKVYLETEGPERVAYTVNETVRMCEELGLGKQIMLNCFDAYVLEYTYLTYGKKYFLHGFYPYSIMKNVKLNPSLYLDYACYWTTGQEAKKRCEELRALKIEPCTGSDTSEDSFFEAVSYGCTLFTENNAKSIVEWRNSIE